MLVAGHCGCSSSSLRLSNGSEYLLDWLLVALCLVMMRLKLSSLFACYIGFVWIRSTVLHSRCLA